jgi:hypothetical protein
VLHGNNEHSRGDYKGVSSLKVNQIRTKLRSMFEAYLDLSDLKATDQEREQKVLSRWLAALAIYLQTGCAEKEAAESVWDGSDDNGIDAAYFDTGTSQVLFVQAKWINKGTGEPEAKEIHYCPKRS